MEDGDHVCLKCGTVVGKENVEDAKKELIGNLSEYQTLLAECEELETMIKPQNSFPVSESVSVRKKSFIRYFWPFIIGAVVAFYVVYMIAVLISTYSTFNSYNPYTTSVSKDALQMSMLGDIMVGWIAAAIAALAIVFIGIKVSKNKQAAFNKNADMISAEISERYRKGLLNQKMIDLHTQNTHKMRLYEDLVPEDYRTSAMVSSIIGILKENKAQSVEEAVKLI